VENSMIDNSRIELNKAIDTLEEEFLAVQFELNLFLSVLSD